jgi:hypothetical protein
MQGHWIGAFAAANNASADGLILFNYNIQMPFNHNAFTMAISAKESRKYHLRRR